MPKRDCHTGASKQEQGVNFGADTSPPLRINPRTTPGLKLGRVIGKGSSPQTSGCPRIRDCTPTVPCHFTLKASQKRGRLAIDHKSTRHNAHGSQFNTKPNSWGKPQPQSKLTSRLQAPRPAELPMRASSPTGGVLINAFENAFRLKTSVRNASQCPILNPSGALAGRAGVPGNPADRSGHCPCRSVGSAGALSARARAEGRGGAARDQARDKPAQRERPPYI